MSEQEKSSSWSRFRARLTINPATRMFARTLAEPRGTSSFYMNTLTNRHYYCLLLGTTILGINYYFGMFKCVAARKETFGRNKAHLE